MQHVMLATSALRIVSENLCSPQFLVISYVVGKEAIGHIQNHRAPEEGGLLLGIAAASVLVLGTLCGLKYDLSVRGFFLLALVLCPDPYVRICSSIVTWEYVEGARLDSGMTKSPSMHSNQCNPPIG